MLDTGSDTGNSLGVAIYVKGQQVVLVSEMEAGWYRYVSRGLLARFVLASAFQQCRVPTKTAGQKETSVSG